MYHPQSGWFDEGPQRGPTLGGKGLKALQSQPVTCSADRRACVWPCQARMVTSLQETWGFIARRSALPQSGTPERQSLCASHRQRRWLTRWSYAPHASAVNLKKLEDRV